MSRKDFLLHFAALTLIPQACKNPVSKIKGSIVGANSAHGHKLRSPINEKAVKSSHKKIVIVGGGVAGLSAAYQLKKQGVTDFVLLELNNEVGGNAASGENENSKYPWGAHYLPVPDNRDKELLALLEEFGAITHYNEQGLPSYNEEYLCFDPEERLYINGYWQEGLVPRFGVPLDEQHQIGKFFKHIDEYRNAVGKDGKDAFCFPVSQCSTDPEFLKLDEISFRAYLTEHGFTSPHLTWYLNYCTKDDYGGKIGSVSAWAGIHYFAARKGKAANTDSDTQLTWPEGNAWLVKQLREKVKEHIITNALVFNVKQENEVVKTTFLHDVCEEIVSEKVIVCTPQFIAKRIVKGYDETFPSVRFKYAPWMVANISADHFSESAKGFPMSWDNVFYGSRSLGYVNACHQHIRQFESKKVLTYYYPLCELSPKEARTEAMNKTHAQWVELICDDLKRVHPDIIHNINNIDVWLWGHGMVLPETGLQQQRIDRGEVMSMGNAIYFANSDLSGISVFEEAFHQGTSVAKLFSKNKA